MGEIETEGYTGPERRESRQQEIADYKEEMSAARRATIAVLIILAAIALTITLYINRSDDQNARIEDVATSNNNLAKEIRGFIVSDTVQAEDHRRRNEEVHRVLLNFMVCVEKLELNRTKTSQNIDACAERAEFENGDEPPGSVPAERNTGRKPSGSRTSPRPSPQPPPPPSPACEKELRGTKNVCPGGKK